MEIYRNKNWGHIEDHVNFILAKQAFHLNLLDKAVEYFVNILQDSQQPSQQQADYLREFLYIYKVNCVFFLFCFSPLRTNFFWSL